MEAILRLDGANDVKRLLRHIMLPFVRIQNFSLFEMRFERTDMWGIFFKRGCYYKGKQSARTIGIHKQVNS